MRALGYIPSSRGRAYGVVRSRLVASMFRWRTCSIARSGLNFCGIHYGAPSLRLLRALSSACAVMYCAVQLLVRTPALPQRMSVRFGLRCTLFPSVLLDSSSCVLEAQHKDFRRHPQGVGVASTHRVLRHPLERWFVYGKLSFVSLLAFVCGPERPTNQYRPCELRYR